MRTGVIVYLMGENQDPDREPAIIAAVKKSHNADQVEVVSQGQKHFDVMDAWWKLTARGMQRFICLLAVDKPTATQVLPRPCLRICK